MAWIVLGTTNWVSSMAVIKVHEMAKQNEEWSSPALKRAVAHDPKLNSAVVKKIKAQDAFEKAANDLREACRECNRLSPLETTPPEFDFAAICDSVAWR